MKQFRKEPVLTWIILISLVIRGFVAATLELGNDEVYYRTYALFPQWSHFDHPPMVGWIIQIFTLDLLLEHEFFIRLGAVFFGTANTWLIYITAAKLKNRLAGLYAAFLYSVSLYFFIIAGLFILPDTPQVFFWLLSIYFLSELTVGKPGRRQSRAIILGGMAAGMAMLSKYTSAFIWLGAIVYVIFWKKYWLKRPALYISIMISLLLFFPVVWWNIANDFGGILYHSGRVSLIDNGIRPDYLLMEVLGEILYHNPFNVLIIVISITAFFRGNRFIKKDVFRYLLLTGLPVIAIFIGISLFRRTLPHWSGPGYISLLLIASSWLAEKNRVTAGGSFRFLSSLRLKGSVFFLLTVIIIGYAQIKTGIIPLGDSSNSTTTTLGKKDISLDLYGWKQIGRGFCERIDRDTEAGIMPADPAVITYRWFPAAHLDYYVCRRCKCDVLTIGQLSSTHKYQSISEKRWDMQLGDHAYYLTTSRDYRHPSEVYASYFKDFEPADTIRVYRYGKHEMNAFIYRCLYLKVIPDYY